MEPRKREKPSMSGTKMPTGTKKLLRKRRKSSLPAAKKQRPISVTARATQGEHHMTKRVSNGEKNLTLKKEGQ